MSKATQFNIRPAISTDVPSITRVHVDSWRTTYAGILPADFLANLSEEQRALQWTRALQQSERNFLFVAGADERVVGFVDAGPRAEENADYPGEIYAIYLFKQYQGRGLGRALFERAVIALREHGYEAFMLWVLSANPARGFYEKMGGKLIDKRMLAIGGASVEEIAYGWGKV